MKGPVTREELEAALLKYGSLNAAARAYNMSPQTLGSRAQKIGLSARQFLKSHHAAIAEAASNEVELTIDGPWQPDELLAEKGLDPTAWDVVQVMPNNWQGLGPGGEVVELYQLKVVARKKVIDPPVMPARDLGVIRKPRKRKQGKKPIVIALPSDTHAPHADPGLEQCWLDWCAEVKPERIVHLGDLMNLSKPSRHRQNLAAVHNDTPDECVQAGFNWWRDTLAAAGDQCIGEQIPGNHDLRVQIACMERMPECYDLKRPGEEHPWWDLEYMVGLGELGVTYHRPEGEYHSVEVQIAEGLGVWHGAKSGPHGGALKDAGRQEGSRAQGHSHKQALTYVVRYRDGEPHLHVQVDVGTMCRRDLGYQPTPDTQQGFATVVVFPDGYWNIELARYDDRRKRLVWRDQMYSAA